MSYNVTEQDERIAREETQKKLRAIVPRELLPNGSYAPVPGIFDIGWKGLLDLPYFDFVKSMREFDNSIIKENEQWTLRLAPVIANGELTSEQLRRFEVDFFRAIDMYPILIVKNVFDNLHNREVRDLIIRHSAEEVGHSELEADFLVNGFGMNRLDIWEAKPLLKSHAGGPVAGGELQAMKDLRNESPELCYALEPFLERSVPMFMRITGKALREKYGFKSSVLGFFDLHTYIDIYHERFGAYIMAKYADGKRAQELFREAVLARRQMFTKIVQDVYYALKAK